MSFPYYFILLGVFRAHILLAVASSSLPIIKSLHNKYPGPVDYAELSAQSSHQKLREDNQSMGTRQELDGFPKSWGESCRPSTDRHDTNQKLSTKGAEGIRTSQDNVLRWGEANFEGDTPFSDISVTQLPQNQESDCDIHAGPSTEADHPEIIPHSETIDPEAYAEARAGAFKELTLISRSYDIDLLERAIQDLKAARDETITLPLANSNAALIHYSSVGHNHGTSQVLTSMAREHESPISPGLPKIPKRPGPSKMPTHGYEWRKELYRTHPQKKATAKLIKAIIRHHDFEELGEYDSPEDLSALEKVFGLQDIEWSSECDRGAEIHDRAFSALMRYLTTLG